MGLDQYLSVSKYVSNCSHRSDREKREYNTVLKAMGIVKKDMNEHAVGGSVELTVAYWRKANQIHKWFVKNVQDGEDDCEKYSVDWEQLVALKAICKEVLENPELAESELPTGGGFFFGSTQYGEDYLEQLKDTVKQLDKILNNPIFKDGGGDFEYRASW